MFDAKYKGRPVALKMVKGLNGVLFETRRRQLFTHARKLQEKKLAQPWNWPRLTAPVLLFLFSEKLAWFWCQIWCLELDEAVITDFCRECTIVASLPEHPNLVPLQGICIFPPVLCLVSDLCESTLFQLLHAERSKQFLAPHPADSGSSAVPSADDGRHTSRHASRHAAECSRASSVLPALLRGSTAASAPKLAGRAAGGVTGGAGGGGGGGGGRLTSSALWEIITGSGGSAHAAAARGEASDVEHGSSHGGGGYSSWTGGAERPRRRGASAAAAAEGAARAAAAAAAASKASALSWLRVKALDRLQVGKGGCIFFHSAAAFF